MKRIIYYGLACSTAIALMTGLGVPSAQAVPPNPNSAVLTTRFFNDCPGSTLIASAAGYPALISISDDAENTCTGFANLHVWRFSTNGTSAVQFANVDIFRYSADLVIAGPGQGEAGLQISPWWSPVVEGRLNIRTTDGEIALFGGVLPGYNFTQQQGVTYTKGTPIHVELNYVSHSNTELDPATLEAKFDYNGQHYTSGLLPFTNCNPNEQPVYGCYGDLNQATVGGHLQPLWQAGQNQEIHAEWRNIQYFPDVKPTATTPVSWGSLKTIYR